jgi:PhnB protein
MQLPNNHSQVMPYYMVNDAKQFIAFMEAAFDAKKGKIIHLEGTEKVIHGELLLGKGALFFADASADGLCGPECAQEDHKEVHQHHKSMVQLFVYVSDVESVCTRAERHGATIVMPPADSGDGLMGGFVDPFGTLWWAKETTR